MISYDLYLSDYLIRNSNTPPTFLLGLTVVLLVTFLLWLTCLFKSNMKHVYLGSYHPVSILNLHLFSFLQTTLFRCPQLSYFLFISFYILLFILSATLTTKSFLSFRLLHISSYEEKKPISVLSYLIQFFILYFCYFSSKNSFFFFFPPVYYSFHLI